MLLSTTCIIVACVCRCADPVTHPQWPPLTQAEIVSACVCNTTYRHLSQPLKSVSYKIFLEGAILFLQSLRVACKIQKTRTTHSCCRWPQLFSSYFFNLAWNKFWMRLFSGRLPGNRYKGPILRAWAKPKQTQRPHENMRLAEIAPQTRPNTPNQTQPSRQNSKTASVK